MADSGNVLTKMSELCRELNQRASEAQEHAKKALTEEGRRNWEEWGAVNRYAAAFLDVAIAHARFGSAPGASPAPSAPTPVVDACPDCGRPLRALTSGHTYSHVCDNCICYWWKTPEQFNRSSLNTQYLDELRAKRAGSTSPASTGAPPVDGKEGT